jgi:hypothetical protein
MNESSHKKSIIRTLCQVIALISFIILLDLLVSESMETLVIMRPNQGRKIEYFVPYTGGGTSKCYPITFSKLTQGQNVVLKRSIFIDICVVIPISRKPIDKAFDRFWLGRHPVE